MKASTVPCGTRVAYHCFECDSAIDAAHVRVRDAVMVHILDTPVCTWHEVTPVFDYSQVNLGPGGVCYVPPDLSVGEAFKRIAALEGRLGIISTGVLDEHRDWLHKLSERVRKLEATQRCHPPSVLCFEGVELEEWQIDMLRQSMRRRKP